MITFYNPVGGGINPQRADKSVHGTLPTNGFRYCEAVRTASGFGWYIYLPFEIIIDWDGLEYHWSIDSGENWYLLTDAIQYPNFSTEFDEHAPENVKGYSPPFLSRTQDPNILQVWSGLFARTEEGVASYIKAPSNMDNGQGYSVMEGVVQTEWWFGPLFTNLKIHRQGRPIVFRPDRPLFQVMPFSNAFYDRFEKAKPTIFEGLPALKEDDWQAYANTVVRRMETRTKLGDYAIEARQKMKEQAKAAGCPVHQ